MLKNGLCCSLNQKYFSSGHLDHENLTILYKEFLNRKALASALKIQLWCVCDNNANHYATPHEIEAECQDARSYPRHLPCSRECSAITRRLKRLARYLQGEKSSSAIYFPLQFYPPLYAFRVLPWEFTILNCRKLLPLRFTLFFLHTISFFITSGTRKAAIEVSADRNKTVCRREIQIEDSTAGPVF
jgi:hypothetical protein